MQHNRIQSEAKKEEKTGEKKGENDRFAPP